mmetsp:Transcript_31463/g.39105  ORF Transcript_31463/g.39105 Transcript_31463/m.39105 type:complete len:205 (-) Transcript_31463:118-732(-)|eukprot:CAMPEP_0170465920 /NCGR_PEP_ID=MMETSP0123-20130129/10078_1 /TAXON_ID=182087 /ORGANISM="Favella ehrenbergii, Strain Fehren 1" /LENGTH=204 /DNA_ID=CAMNT_0010731927 /DNA_START=516 /DNA_END=1130 /DNA_ORIENTATION=+
MVLAVLHPVDGKLCAEARPDLEAVHDGVVAAESRPARLVGARGSHRKDAIVSVQAIKHRAGLICVHVKQKFFEETFLFHLGESVVELVCVDPLVRMGVRHRHHTKCSMANHVDENLGLLRRLENRARCCFIAEEDLEKVRPVHFAPTVVDLTAVVNIEALLVNRRPVIEGSREGVVHVVGDVIVSEVNNLVSGDSVLYQELHCV